MDQETVANSMASAKHAGPVYVSDEMPGIRRVRDGESFSFVLPDARRVTDPEVLQRIARLAVPPACEDVWICPNAGNTPAVCRKSYINPVVFDAWRSGLLHELIAAPSASGLRGTERPVLQFLRRCNDCNASKHNADALALRSSDRS